MAIARRKYIGAYHHHCLFNKRIKKLEEPLRAKILDSFKVACFTEVPLTQLHRLVGKIDGRTVELEPYGFVFNRDFIAASGGQPAIYVNSYRGNNQLREAADELFNLSIKNGRLRKPIWRLLPFINAMNEHCDFSWEREWRVGKNLQFSSPDVVCLILPDKGEEELKEEFAQRGRAVISPGWTYEQIVSELARQQRNTRAFVKGKVIGRRTEKT